jgi:hypothetical protein
MQLCEDIAHDGGQAAPAVWVMAEYVNPTNNNVNPLAVSVSTFLACDACARYWLSQAWVNVAKLRPVQQERKRDVIVAGAYSFHRDYVNHERFELCVTEGNSVFRTEVSAWGNAVRNLREFIRDCGDPAAVQKAMVSIYQTGYGSVGTANVRLIPVG